MHIVCPHCTTSYAINLASLGASGRTVRCSRCKETWLARPEDAVEAAAPMPAMAEAGPASAETDSAAEWDAMARQEDGQETPVVDSPSISGDWPAEDQETSQAGGTDWPSEAKEHSEELAQQGSKRRFGLPRLPRIPFLPSVGLPTACATMGALVLALVIWRTDMVRLLPQTELFYRLVGLEVNLRGLAFKDVKVTSETVEGTPVLVIEGTIVGAARKPVDLPRLRFSVRDAQGAEIYAWNAVLEQTVLKPGEPAFFKSRLASPPPESRNIDIRFFNKRDLTGGRA
jgi:predicted Zn finger-like uncharacterized protein